MTMSVTAARTPAHSRREPIFSKRLYSEQAMFAVLAWLAATVVVFGITSVVSFFRPVEISGWQIASQAVRWFCFAIGIYLGWSVLQLHVTHGGTRRGYWIRMLAFCAAYTPLVALLYTVSFLAESGFYSLLGWPHVMDERSLYSSASELPLVFIESLLLFTLFLLAGLFISAMWYRSGIMGGLSIVVGLVCANLSGYSLGNYETPFDLDWIEWLRPQEPSLVVALGFHIGMYLALAVLTWLAVRDVEIHSKSAEKG
jgi:hypothetical protein